MPRKFAYACLFSVVFSAVAPRAASPGLGGPPAAFAYHACSPWDGPAVRIILSYGPRPSCGSPGTPSLTFSVNRGMDEGLSGLRFLLDDLAEQTGSRNGTAYFCPDALRCRPVGSVSVNFGAMDGESVSGTVECPSELGPGEVPFRAVVCPSYDVCGS